MRKLGQRDVGSKRIRQVTMAVAEVVEIDVEIPTASFNVRLDYGGNEARDQRWAGAEIEPGWRLNTIPGKGDEGGGHIL